jgi:hypothetical protein
MTTIGEIHLILSPLPKLQLQSLPFETGNPPMDWQLAIHRNQTALVAIIVALMRSVGLVSSGQLTTLPQFFYRKTLLIVRQAESAVRRLIMMAAHDMPLPVIAMRKPRTSKTDFSLISPFRDDSIPAFNLIDPLKDFCTQDIDFEDLDFADDGHSSKQNLAYPNRSPISAAALGQRLLALRHVLDTIPDHAKRLTRWYAARDVALKQRQPHRLSPIRPGPPPASRKRGRTEMDEILRECHLLAIYARDNGDSP